jgi:hypothetical protein
MKALATLLVVLVSLVLPVTASAFTTIGAGTCTEGFDVAGGTAIGVLGLVGPEKHRGNAHQYGETASGSSNAARGAPRAGAALSKAEVSGLRDLFGKSKEGAEALLGRLRAGEAVQVPQGVTRETRVWLRS